MTDIERCYDEIRKAEAALRAGAPEVEGLLQCIQDWQAELRELGDG